MGLLQVRACAPPGPSTRLRPPGGHGWGAERCAPSSPLCGPQKPARGMRDAAGLAGSLLLAPSPDTGPRRRQARTWALAGGRPTYRRGEGRKRSPPLQRDLEALVQQRSVLRARAGVSLASPPSRRRLRARSRNKNKTPQTQRALWVPAALPPTAPRRWSERTANTMPPPPRVQLAPGPHPWQHTHFPRGARRAGPWFS